MAERHNERRQGTRLASRQSSAIAFRGENCGALPPQALVADISEAGLHLSFDWPDGAGFPLRVGDGMSFHLKIEGAEQDFELRSIVQRIDEHDYRGRVGVGVKLCGLSPQARSALQKSLVSLALTRLRTWRNAGRPVTSDAAPGPTSQ